LGPERPRSSLLPSQIKIHEEDENQDVTVKTEAVDDHQQSHDSTAPVQQHAERCESNQSRARFNSVGVKREAPSSLHDDEEAQLQIKILRLKRQAAEAEMEEMQLMLTLQRNKRKVYVEGSHQHPIDLDSV